MNIQSALVLVFFGLSLGLFKIKNAWKVVFTFLIIWGIFPILLEVVWSSWVDLGVLNKLLLIAILLMLFLIGCGRVICGRHVFAEVMGHCVYDATRLLLSGVTSLVILVLDVIRAVVRGLFAAVRAYGHSRR